METAETLVASTEIIARHLAAYLQQTDPMGKTIVFCVDQAHAEQMCQALRRICPTQVIRYPDYVERIVSEEGIEGKRALGRFSTPGERTPVIVTTSKLLSTGVDVPTCKNIVLARPIRSMVEFKQIIGRGTRLYEPDKFWFTIVDYAGATRLFFDPDFDGDPELVEVEPLTPQPPVTATTSAMIETTPPAPATVAIDGGAEYGPRAESAAGTALPAPMSPAPVAQATAPTLTGISNSPIDVQPPSNQPTADAQVLYQPEGYQPLHDESGDFLMQEGTVAVQRAVSDSSDGASAVTLRRPRDGRVFRVAGEIVYELAPDGKTLRRVSLRDYTMTALQSLVTTAADLRVRWLDQAQREEILARLIEEGVDLQALAAAHRLHDVDPLDVLLSVAFGQAACTRRERADRVQGAHAAFFQRFSPAARDILDTILQKYVAGEAPDVSNAELLKVPPLSERGTFVELARHFGGGAALRSTLKEMQRLLYDV
jgi:type I restriction enzyme, R subunit